METESEIRVDPLPGADRIYPSQDPRSQPPPGAPEAFPEIREPAPGARPEPVQPEIPSPESLAPPIAPPPAPAAESGLATEGEGRYSVQLFATGSRAAADARARALARYFDRPLRVVAEGGLFKLRLGSFAERAAAEEVRRRAFDLGFRDAFVVESARSDPAGAR